MSEQNKTGVILLAGFGILFLITLVPLGLVRYPPLVDYPNHLARMHLLTHLESSSILNEFFQIKWAVLPNLVMDVIVPLLARIFPLEIAGRIFIALILLLLLSGACALFYTVHRRISVWPLLAVLFLYNRVLLWGFFKLSFRARTDAVGTGSLDIIFKPPGICKGNSLYRTDAMLVLFSYLRSGSLWPLYCRI